METSAEACWRLSKACGQWAVNSGDSAARIAFRQMATAWARLAFNEEITAPVDERINPPISEKSEATPGEILASSLTTLPSDVEPAAERDDWTRPQKRLSLPRTLSGASPDHAKPPRPQNLAACARYVLAGRVSGGALSFRLPEKSC
jgi:hypothetical protein